MPSANTVAQKPAGSFQPAVIVRARLALGVALGQCQRKLKQNAASTARQITDFHSSVAFALSPPKISGEKGSCGNRKNIAIQSSRTDGRERVHARTAAAVKQIPVKP